MLKEIVVSLPGGDIDSVHIGVFPNRGRFFCQEMERQNEYSYRADVELPDGRSFYVIAINRDFENVYNVDKGYFDDDNLLDRASTVVENRTYQLTEFDLTTKHIVRTDSDHLWVRAKTYFGWIKKAFLVSDTDCKVPLECILERNHEKHWSTSFSPAISGRKFCLCFEGAGRTEFLHSNNKVLPRFSMPHAFSVDDIPSVDTFSKPHAGCQIMPHCFGESSLANDQAIRDQKATLSVIAESLEYIHSLGITMVYLNPVFHAANNHGYDAINHYEVAPSLGGSEDLKFLVDKAHKLGMEVILDVCFNHCSHDFPAFKDLLINQENSVYKDWFVTTDWPVCTSNSLSYSCWSNMWHMPEFNFDDAGVRDYLLDVGLYWLRKFDVDGYRLDVASEIPMPFLNELSTQTKRFKPGFKLIGESWHRNCNFLIDEGGIDGVTNYTVYLDFVKLILKEPSVNLSMAIEELLSYLQLIPIDQIGSCWNFVNNHDVPSFQSFVDDESLFQAALVLIFALPGSPVLYAGDQFEFGDTELIFKLNQIHKEYPRVFENCFIRFPYIDAGNQTFIIERYSKTESLLFIVDLSACGPAAPSYEGKLLLDTHHVKVVAHLDSTGSEA